MILRKFGVLVFLSILGLSSSLADEAWVLREDGVGPVKIGMGLHAMNAVPQERFQLPPEKDDRACFYVKPKPPPHVAFMILDGRWTRIDVEGANISAKGGVQIVDSEIHSVRVHGSKVKVEPSKFTGPDGHYLTLRSTISRYGIRFEIDNAEIT